MEKIITGNGKTLQKEINTWLTKGWKISKIDVCKQLIVDPDSIENEPEFLESIKNNQPVKVKIKGSSIQNNVMFYDYFLITLTKEI